MVPPNFLRLSGWMLGTLIGLVPVGIFSSLAVPANGGENLPELRDFRTGEKIAPEIWKRDGWCGIEITKVYPNTPAAELGIEEGDSIVGLNGWRVWGLEHFEMLAKEPEAGEEVEVVWFREGSFFAGAFRVTGPRLKIGVDLEFWMRSRRPSLEALQAMGVDLPRRRESAATMLPSHIPRLMAHHLQHHGGEETKAWINAFLRQHEAMVECRYEEVRPLAPRPPLEEVAELSDFYLKVADVAMKDQGVEGLMQLGYRRQWLSLNLPIPLGQPRKVGHLRVAHPLVKEVMLEFNEAPLATLWRTSDRWYQLELEKKDYWSRIKHRLRQGLVQPASRLQEVLDGFDRRGVNFFWWDKPKKPNLDDLFLDQLAEIVLLAMEGRTAEIIVLLEAIRKDSELAWLTAVHYSILVLDREHFGWREISRYAAPWLKEGFARYPRFYREMLAVQIGRDSAELPVLVWVGLERRIRKYLFPEYRWRYRLNVDEALRLKEGDDGFLDKAVQVSDILQHAAVAQEMYTENPELARRRLERLAVRADALDYPAVSTPIYRWLAIRSFDRYQTAEGLTSLKLAQAACRKWKENLQYNKDVMNEEVDNLNEPRWTELQLLGLEVEACLSGGRFEEAGAALGKLRPMTVTLLAESAEIPVSDPAKLPLENLLSEKWIASLKNHYHRAFLYQIVLLNASYEMMFYGPKDQLELLRKVGERLAAERSLPGFMTSLLWWTGTSQSRFLEEFGYDNEAYAYSTSLMQRTQFAENPAFFVSHLVRKFHHEGLVEADEVVAGRWGEKSDQMEPIMRAAFAFECARFQMEAGNHELARKELGESIRLLHEQGIEPSFAHLQFFIRLQQETGNDEGLEKLLFDALKSVRQRGLKPKEAGLYASYALFLAKAERWEEAARAAAARTAILRSLKMEMLLPHALFEEARLALRLGAPDRAWALFNEASRRVEDLKNLSPRGMLAYASAQMIFLTEAGRKEDLHKIEGTLEPFLKKAPDHLVKTFADWKKNVLTNVQLIEGKPIEQDSIVFQPVEVVAAVAPSETGFGRFYLSNHGLLSIRGTIKVNAGVLTESWNHETLTWSVRMGDGGRVGSLEIELQPDQQVLLDFDYPKVPENFQSETKIQWTTPKTTKEAIWKVTGGADASQISVVNASLAEGNPFFATTIPQDILVRDAQPLVGFRLRAERSIRIEYYHGETRELLAIDADGNGAFTDAGDSILTRSRAGGGPCFAEVLAGTRIPLEFLVYPEEEGHNSGKPIRLWLELWDGTNWEPYSENILTPKPQFAPRP